MMPRTSSPPQNKICFQAHMGCRDLLVLGVWGLQAVFQMDPELRAAFANAKKPGDVSPKLRSKAYSVLFRLSRGQHADRVSAAFVRSWENKKVAWTNSRSSKPLCWTRNLYGDFHRVDLEPCADA